MLSAVIAGLTVTVAILTGVLGYVLAHERRLTSVEARSASLEQRLVDTIAEVRVLSLRIAADHDMLTGLVADARYAAEALRRLEGGS